METGRERLRGEGLDATLAGFQAGIVGVLAMLAWLGLAAKWYNHSLWTAPNLMASNFYGEAALGQHLSAATFSGLAVYIVVYSLLGALFGLAMHRRAGRGRTMLIAVLCAVAWYLLWWGWLWKSANVLIAMYTHDRPMVVGHVIYGAMMGRFPAYLPKEPKQPAPVQNPEPEPATVDEHDQQTL